MTDPTFAFIGGLHRSGTSLLFRMLREHPDTSGFHGTGAREDEGQHLQQTYASARELGGAGKFALRDEAHLVEVDDETAAKHRSELMNAWGPLWDLDQAVMLEKSPPNLIRMRYLQSVFPGARFLIIARHPVTAALATKKWRRKQSVWSLIHHWVRAYEIALADAAHVDNVMLLRYEDLVREPATTLRAAQEFLGLDPDVAAAASAINHSASDPYTQRWRETSTHLLKKRYVHALQSRFGDSAARFGYRIDNLDALGPWTPTTS